MTKVPNIPLILETVSPETFGTKNVMHIAVEKLIKLFLLFSKRHFNHTPSAPSVVHGATLINLKWLVMLFISLVYENMK